MSTPVTWLTTDLVAVAWIRTIPGLYADVVATTLPAEDQWEQGGAIQVPATVGGTPHSFVPVRQPVVQVDCWATAMNSSKIPWWKASRLAEQVRLATYDRSLPGVGRALAISVNGVAYPSATVKAATVLTEPRRIWSDEGDWGGFSVDLRLNWVQVGEVIP